MIPRIIHQTWKDRNLSAEDQAMQATWKSLHPEWQYRFWTDEDNQRLVEEHYPELLELWSSYQYPIQRVDLVRILYLHKYGGLYVDLDFECLKPIDELLTPYLVVMGCEYGGLGVLMRGEDFTCNALLASVPGHEFWDVLLREMAKANRRKRFFEMKVSFVLYTTACAILDRVAKQYQVSHDDLVIYPKEMFYPSPVMQRDPAEKRREAQQQDSYALHHNAHTWNSPGKITQGLIRLMGPALERRMAGKRV